MYADQQLTSHRPAPPTPRTPPHAPLDVLVIGAGQAGLAVGYHLAHRRLRFLLVDAAPAIGHSSRSRWDSLRLFTPAEYDALPGLPFPATPGTYPGKDEVADYLATYAARFDLPVMLNTRVEHVDQGGGLFRVATSQGTLSTRQVVVATGPFQQPHIPAMSGRFDARVTQLHTSAYRNPSSLPDGKVLVVGAGNSGLQIALELSRTREVHLAVGRRQKTVPQRPLGRDLFWWLTRTGLITRPASSPVAAWFRKRSGDLVIGTTWDDVDAAGITVHPRLVGTDVRSAKFSDGSVLDDVASVVWATGYRSDYAWLDVPGVCDGAAITHTRGRTGTPGLWFIGLPWQHTRGSALLGFVGDDAAWVATEVAAQALDIPARGMYVNSHSYPLGVSISEGAAMSTTTYRVTGMTCGHCVAAVKQEVGAIADVTDVQVDLVTGEVTVSSARPLTYDEISAAIDEAGYELAS